MLSCRELMGERIALQRVTEAMVSQDLFFHHGFRRRSSHRPQPDGAEVKKFATRMPPFVRRAVRHYAVSETSACLAHPSVFRQHPRCFKDCNCFSKVETGGANCKSQSSSSPGNTCLMLLRCRSAALSPQWRLLHNTALWCCTTFGALEREATRSSRLALSVFTFPPLQEILGRASAPLESGRSAVGIAPSSAPAFTQLEGDPHPPGQHLTIPRPNLHLHSQWHEPSSVNHNY
jgi:hypothetical protein